jgi:hypothetical protein|tara:strand:- start:234 stop:626 length:393 start_codon:yes stop_codon:yes gene_type:complete
MWANLVTPLAGIVGNYMESRAAVSKAKVQAKVAKVEAEAEVSKKIAAGEVDWENTMADATKESWKDELSLIVLLLPLPLVMFEGTRDAVKEGFAILETLPDWYQYLLFIAISSSFGIKGADKLMSMRRKK